MAIIFPQRKAADSQTANTVSATGAILGERDRLQQRPFGRPRRIGQVAQLGPQAFLGGASSPDSLFAPREENDGA